MELIIFIIIVGVVMSNINKQRRARPSAPPDNADAPREVGVPNTARPRTPVVRPMEARPQTPTPFAPRQQHSMPAAPAKPASAKSANAPGKARPFAPAAERPQAIDDLPRDVDSPAQGTSPAADAHMQPALRDMGRECDDGYGSLEHTSHEGQELHAPGVHSDAAVDARFAGRPGELAERLSEDDDDDLNAMEELSGEGITLMSDDGEAPELMGERLDAAAMRRAVVMSEILNKRGGRHGWART